MAKIDPTKPIYWIDAEAIDSLTDATRLFMSNPVVHWQIIDSPEKIAPYFGIINN